MDLPISTGYLTDVLVIAGIQAIVAIGLYITLASGQFSTAHAALMGVGAYASGYVSVRWHLPLVAALAVGVFAAAAVGGAMGALVIRLDDLYLGIATLAFGETLSILARNISAVGGADGLEGVPLVTEPWMVAATIVVLLYGLHRLRYSRLVLGLDAVRTDRIAAASLGLPVRALRIGAFALGGSIAGLGGCFYVHYIGLIEPRDLNFAQEVNLFLFVIVGGINSYWGPLLGSVTVASLIETLRAFTSMRYVLLGGILAILMVVRPNGVLGRRPYRPPSARRRRIWWLGRNSRSGPVRSTPPAHTEPGSDSDVLLKADGSTVPSDVVGGGDFDDRERTS
jgi:branched-chain amino acid transport system permease protein